MNKEVFIALMKGRKWQYDGYPDTDGIQSSDPNFNWQEYQTTNMFYRGGFRVGISEKSIEQMTEDHFDNWFIESTKGFHFYDDWQDAFTGSEFLIPIVEQEFTARERLTNQRVLGTLLYLKDHPEQIQSYIDEYETKLKS